MKKPNQHRNKQQKASHKIGATTGKQREPNHSEAQTVFARFNIRLFLRSVASGRQWLEVCGAIGGIIAAIYAATSFHHTIGMEEREGKLGGQLQVVFFKGAPLNEDRPTYFFFAIPQGSDDKAGFVMPLHFRVKNDSNASDQSVNLIIQYDRALLSG